LRGEEFCCIRSNIAPGQLWVTRRATAYARPECIILERGNLCQAVIMSGSRVGGDIYALCAAGVYAA